MTVRKGAFYFTLALNLLVLFGLAIGGAFLVDTRDTQEASRGSLRAACERNNRRADATYWATAALVERALLEGDQAAFRDGTRKLAGLTLGPREKPQPGRPWLVDCEAAYP